MHEWKLGVGAGCGLQFFNSVIVLFAIEMRLSHKQMQFRRVLADFKQAAKSALLEVGVLRLSSRYAKRVEVIQLIRGLRPQRFQGCRSFSVVFGEEVTEAQQVTCLKRVRRVFHHGRERRNRRTEIVLPIVHQPNIQADSGYTRCEMLRLIQHRKRWLPLLAAHVDHAQVRVRPRQLRVRRQHGAKVLFSLIKTIAFQSQFALLEFLLRIGGRFRLSRGPQSACSECKEQSCAAAKCALPHLQ